MFPAAAFFSYVIVANLSPGPNAILSLSNAGRYGLKKALRFNLGIAAGVFVVLLLCGGFSLTIVRLFPPVQSALVWIGAGYILWLAWQTLKSSPQAEMAENEQTGRLFLQGAFLQFINPNTLLYGVTVFTTFIIPSYQSPLSLTFFLLLLSLAAFLCTGCWTFFGTLFQKIVAQHGKAVNLVMALLLVYCAISLLFQTVG